MLACSTCESGTEARRSVCPQLAVPIARAETKTSAEYLITPDHSPVGPAPYASSLEPDQHAIGPKGQLQPLAARFQAHHDALVVAEPKHPSALVAQCPT